MLNIFISVHHLLVPTFKLIPLGFSMSSVINKLCKSVGLARPLPLPAVSVAALVLIEVSLSKLGVGLSLIMTLEGIVSSALARVLDIFSIPNGDADFSGVDGRGDDDGLPFAVVTDDTPDLNADFGGAETSKEDETI